MTPGFSIPDPALMTHSEHGVNGPPPDTQEDRFPGWVTGLLAAESIALGIALVAPLTPSKTGSTWSPAHLFTADPTYLEKVAASFVVVNGLLLFLGLVAWVVSRRGSD